MAPPILTDELIALHPMRMEHAAGYSAVLSDPGSHHFLTDSGPVDLTAARIKIEANHRKMEAGQAIYWSILNQANEFLGFVALHQPMQPKAFMSYGIHPDARRKGFASRAVSLVWEWEGLKGKSIEMATHLDNEVSFAFLSKLAVEYKGIQQTDFGERHVFVKET